ncbi:MULTISPECIES: ECF transporter S component [unclassified Paenibacillus]|uniref:ECF transporter S component n=1 Tax=unclassified Paenibacillus TaxID=185978 RepID=UPI001AEA4B6E|nr:MULTISPECIES: ECF transporter S component [unclassified Paenibacillus]MBP1156676.1 energy-coupling factor transport system substrate-specific component [Paenibacillus sp. PvP091]MBP1172586.1 energy-coupling factor transport system substrate-specific component [Paenibacillus sp. PvR098]MBP2438966.1 energy-coupling factor transport system substrate-specific component [Paenibacillus sp. PvP052]
MSKRLKLTDILVTVVIAVVFSIIYRVWTDVYNLAKLPGIQLDQFMYGMWFMAATVAFLIIRKPGVAFLAEVAAASGELIVGSPYGVEVLTYGVLQGIGAELIFAAFLYKRFSAAVAGLAGIAAGTGALALDFFKGYLLELQTWNLVLYIVMRFIGSFLICGPLAYLLVKALEKTGVTQLVRPASAGDYEDLDRKSVH